MTCVLVINNPPSLESHESYSFASMLLPVLAFVVVGVWYILQEDLPGRFRFHIRNGLGVG